MAEMKNISMADLEANPEAYKVAMTGYIVSRGAVPFTAEKATPAFFTSMFGDPQFLTAFENAKTNIAERNIAERNIAERDAVEKLPEIIEQPRAAAPKQGSIFELLSQRTAEAKQRKEATLKIVETEKFITDNPNLAPIRHLQADFFVCDLVDYALKDDQASMEAPIFSLSTREDLKIWKWTSEDGKKSVEVQPSVCGRATQHDKDILIYCTSQLTEAINQKKTTSKTVRFTAYDLLIATNRNICGRDYDRLKAAMDRLAGTRIKTDIKTGGERSTKNFGLIDSWEIVEKSPENSRMVAIEVTLSDWLFSAIQAHEVLTILPDYFRLRKPLERRLYEIARKHVGKQGSWKISLNALHGKSGSTDVVRNFKSKLKEIIDADTIPQYRYQLCAGDIVMIYDRDPNAALKFLL